MIEKARMVLMGGMGYPLTETPWGMPKLKTRLEAIGVQVLLISWKDRQQCYDFLHDNIWTWIGLAGDSLGAGSAAQYAGDLKKPVDYVAGFQPSMHDERTQIINGEGIIFVPANVKRAHCVYDPWWIDTAGLGSAKYRETDTHKTKLLITEHRGAHPDDWGYSQDIIFNEIKGLLK